MTVMTSAARKPRTIRRRLKQATQTVRAIAEMLNELARAVRALARILMWGSVAAALALTSALLITGHPVPAELLELITTALPR